LLSTDSLVQRHDGASRADAAHALFRFASSRAPDPPPVRQLHAMARLSGLKVRDLVVGEGNTVAKGSTVTIRYDGFLNRGDRFQEQVVTTFRVGKREVIAGLERGVVGMKPGGRRRISVGPHLAYREAGVPGKVPPNAKLVFEVEVLSVVEVGVA
jgi:FKBP-type peptidyl-prolyl cis-trans isomerase